MVSMKDQAQAIPKYVIAMIHLEFISLQFWEIQPWSNVRKIVEMFPHFTFRSRNIRIPQEKEEEE